MSQSINNFALKHLELDALLDITVAINRQSDEKSLLKIFLFTLIANFKISSLLLYEWVDEKWEILLKHGLTKDFIPHSQELMQVLEMPVFLSFEEAEFKSLNEYFDFSIPLVIDGKIVSCLVLGGAKKFIKQTEAIKFIQTMLNILYVAIQNVRLSQKKIEQETLKNELLIAQKLQSNLFPQTLPVKEDLKIFSTYIPHQSVGGDYYDFIELPDGDFLISIADVSGKGLPAAFVMSNFQAAFRVLAKLSLRIEDVIVELNKLVYENTKGEKFITFFVAKYFKNKNVMQYCNCGHNPPLLMAYDKSVQLLTKGSMILGVFPQLPHIETGKIYNINNSILMAYTDGLVESFDQSNPDKGLQMITRTVQENKDFSKLHTEILKNLHIATQAVDDITLISCWFSTESNIDQ